LIVPTRVIPVYILDMIELLFPLGLNKYDTWRILSVKCYNDNSMHLRSCIKNVNKDLFGCELESIKDPLGSLEDPSTQLPQRRQIKMSHYIPPPLVSTNLESRPVIRSVSDRYENFTFSIHNGY
jgi:hypothetical protein